MAPKKLKINKLFYGKWPYKISTKVPGGSLLRSVGIEGAKEYCSNDKNPLEFGGYYSFIYRRVISKADLLKYINLIEPYIGMNKNIQFRMEYNTVNIYTNDYDLYLDMQTQLYEYVISVTEPETTEELNTLLDSNKLVICDKYPHREYQFKVYFKNTMPASCRTSLHNWATKYQNGQIYINRGTARFLSQSRRYYGEYYFYLKDKKMVPMLVLAAQGNVRKIEEFVLRSSINTTQQGELSC
jgi:hypothetical protein